FANQMSALWNPEVRARIGNGFSRTGLSYASLAFGQAAQSIDSYARDWVRARRELCEVANRSDGTSADLDLRRRCLERRKDDLRECISARAHPDPQWGARPAHAAGRLPPLPSCNDVPRAHPDAAEIRRSAPIDTELGHGKALFETGQFTAGE